MNATTRDALRRGLEDWYEPLRSFTKLKVHAVEYPESIAWIEVHDRSGLSPTTTTVLEAVELMAYLARVDWTLWRQVAAEIWPAIDTERAEAFMLRSFEVRVRVEVWSSTVENFNQVWVAYHHTDAPSEGFLEMKQLMEGAHAGSASVTPVRLCVTGHQVEETLMKVEQPVLEKCSREGDATHRQGCVGCLSITELDANTIYVTPARAILCLLIELAHHGIVVENLRLDDDFPTDCEKELWSKALWGMWGVGRSLSTTLTATGATSARIPWLQKRFIVSTFLALHASDSIQTLSVFNPLFWLSDFRTDETRRLHWMWLTYAVFLRMRREAPRLQHMEIHVQDLRATDVGSMRQLLESPCPLAKLLKVEGGTPNAAGAVETIAASRFCLRKPSIDSTHVVSGWHFSHIPVLERSGDWLAVLLPGWGCAWVHQQDVVKCNAVAVPTDRVVSSVPSLHLKDLSDWSLEPVSEWLRLVGHGVRRLEVLERSVTTHLDAWCRELFEICPLLEMLEIQNGCFESLAVFVDAYDSGVCRLKRLVLRPQEIDDIDASMTELLEAMRDPHHAASTHLSEFVCQPRESPGNIRPAHLILAKQMLEQNQRVRVLELVGPVDAAEFESSIHELELLDETSVVVPSRLAKLQKLAFLSAVSNRHQNQVVPRNLTELGADVVAGILQFVGAWRARRVSATIEY